MSNKGLLDDIQTLKSQIKTPGLIEATQLISNLKEELFLVK